MNTVRSVIRIEHPLKGMGLWWSSDKDGLIIKRHTQYRIISARHRGPNFPAYDSDVELARKSNFNCGDYHFAFKSLEQLRTALTPEELKECIQVLGFRVLMLDVTEFHESAYQIIFKKESIKESKDISFMFL